MPLFSEICAGLEWIRLFQVVNHVATHFFETYFIIITAAYLHSFGSLSLRDSVVKKMADGWKSFLAYGAQLNFIVFEDYYHFFLQFELQHMLVVISKIIHLKFIGFCSLNIVNIYLLGRLEDV